MSLIKRIKKAIAALSTERVISAQRSRFNPLRNFTPEKLVQAIEHFDSGYLGPLAHIIEALEQRDDVWKTAARKAKASVARCNHQILIVEGQEGNPKAQQHKDTLEKFWANITVTDAFKRNLRGGRSLLVKQMMDAVGSVYACHEIIWKTEPDGELTATFIRVPLWMFENTTGTLRFLPTEATLNGIDMPAGEWMVTVGDGVGIAASIAAMSKRLSVSDWLLYSERCGQPGLHAKTPATQDTPEWKRLVQAVRNYGREWNLVTNPDVEIDPVNMSTTGTLPYPPLVTHMDKAIAALWRGADLSTISGASGKENTGASLQGEESDLLEQDSCEMISETLQYQVEQYVIEYVHGDTTPLAYIQIMPESRPDLKQDMEIDRHLTGSGVKLSKNEALRRYQRTEVDPKDPNDAPLEPSLTPYQTPATHPYTLTNVSLANAALAGDATATTHIISQRKDAALTATARQAILTALAADLQPLRDRIATALSTPDHDLIPTLRAILADIPTTLYTQISQSGQLDDALEQTLTAAIFNQLATEAALRQGAPHA